MLEKVKKQVLDNLSSQNEKDIKRIDHYKNLYPKLFNEIKELERTHILSLNEEGKKIFFKQILNNLRLPYLIDERKSIQQEIIESKKNLISENLLKKYNKISDEIKNIRNKDLE